MQQDFLKFAHLNPTVTPEYFNDYTLGLVQKWARGAVELASFHNKITIDADVIINLARIWDTPAEIISKATDSWHMYSATVSGKKAARAGLTLPPARIRAVLAAMARKGQQIGEPAVIILTSIIEAAASSPSRPTAGAATRSVARERAGEPPARLPLLHDL